VMQRSEPLLSCPSCVHLHLTFGLRISHRLVTSGLYLQLMRPFLHEVTPQPTLQPGLPKANRRFIGLLHPRRRQRIGPPDKFFGYVIVISRLVSVFRGSHALQLAAVPSPNSFDGQLPSPPFRFCEFMGPNQSNQVF
jgi:hypothetical protein